MERSFWKYLFLLVVMGVAVYSPVFTNPFIWDDQSLVLSNPYLRPGAPFRDIFTRDLLYGSIPSSNFYRPLQTLTYRWDYFFWRTNPGGYHLTNLLLHLFVSSLILLFLLQLHLPRFLPLLICLLFLVHPVHTEAVAYISGRADLLAGVFICLSLFFYLQGIRLQQKVLFFSSGLFFLLALLGKEVSLIFPVAFLLFAVRKGERQKLASKWLASFFFLAAVIYILLRLGPLDFSTVPPFHSYLAWPRRFLTFTKALPVYLGLLLFPINLHMERTLPPTLHPVEANVIIPLVIFISFLLLLFYSCRRAPLLFAGGAWSFLWLLPVSNLIPLNTFLAEHWLYPPSGGFILATVLLFSFLPKRLLLSGLTIVLVCFSILTWRRSKEWGQPLLFFQKSLCQSPSSPMLYLALGNHYLEKGAWEQAEEKFFQALQLKPGFPEAHNNLALIYYHRGETGRALAEVQQALRSQPEYQDALNNLGQFYQEIGELEKARENFQKLLRINPLFAEAHNNLGIVLYRLDDREGAEQKFRDALRLHPLYPEAAYNLGNIFLGKGNSDAAVYYYQVALRLKTDYLPARVNLGSAYAQQGDYVSARRQWEVVLQLDPDNLPAQENLKRLQGQGR